MPGDMHACMAAAGCISACRAAASCCKACASQHTLMTQRRAAGPCCSLLQLQASQARVCAERKFSFEHTHMLQCVKRTSRCSCWWGSTRWQTPAAASSKAARAVGALALPGWWRLVARCLHPKRPGQVLRGCSSACTHMHVHMHCRTGAGGWPVHDRGCAPAQIRGAELVGNYAMPVQQAWRFDR